MATKRTPLTVAALILTALTLTVLNLTAGPAAAQGAATVGECAPGLGIGLLQVPKASYSDPRARSYIVDSVQPGSTFSRDFQVCNGTKASLSVSLYPGSATIQDSSFTLDTGRGENELTRWMTVTPAVLVLPSGTAAKATVSFTVPVDAAAGERYGAVIADAPAQPHGGVAVGGRVGVRVYLEVSKGGAPKSDFAIDSLQAVRRADGSPAVLAKVHNTGARALDLRGNLRLSDGPGGLSAGPFAAELGTTLAPGATAQVAVPLPAAITGGPWTAVMAIQSGVLEHRAEGRVTFPQTAGASNPEVRALPLLQDTQKVGIVAAGLIGLVALLLLALALRRRSRSQGVQPA